jgi:hypothetical protein
VNCRRFIGLGRQIKSKRAFNMVLVISKTQANTIRGEKCDYKR